MYRDLHVLALNLYRDDADGGLFAYIDACATLYDGLLPQFRTNDLSRQLRHFHNLHHQYCHFDVANGMINI